MSPCLCPTKGCVAWLLIALIAQYHKLHARRAIRTQPRRLRERPHANLDPAGPRQEFAWNSDADVCHQATDRPTICAEPPSTGRTLPLPDHAALGIHQAQCGAEINGHWPVGAPEQDELTFVGLLTTPTPSDSSLARPLRRTPDQRAAPRKPRQQSGQGAAQRATASQRRAPATDHAQQPAPGDRGWRSSANRRADLPICDLQFASVHRRPPTAAPTRQSAICNLQSAISPAPDQQQRQRPHGWKQQPPLIGARDLTVGDRPGK